MTMHPDYDSDHSFLMEYRAHVLLLREQTAQLEQTGSDGAPEEVRSLRLRGVSSATNVPTAAAMQLWEGMEQRCQITRAWLEDNAAQAAAIVARIQHPKSCFILGRYYLQGFTDQDIASELSLSREHVNRLRHSACRTL